MKIINKKISDLVPYENNPRLNENAISAVAASISKFGFKTPVIIDKNNIIVCGHTRILSAKTLGMEEVPCIIADDLTEEQIKAFRLADNKTAELASWNIELLEAELAEISDIDMSQFGFEADIFQEEGEVVEDNFDEEPPEQPISQSGQIYQLGRHRLMVGDSTKRNKKRLYERWSISRIFDKSF